MHKFLVSIFSAALISSLVQGCITAESTFTRVAPGIWRGVLELDKFQIPVRDKDAIIVLHDQFKENELPFNFEVAPRPPAVDATASTTTPAGSPATRK